MMTTPSLPCVATHDNRTSIECIKSMHVNHQTEFSFTTLDNSTVKSHLYKTKFKESHRARYAPS